MERKKAAEERLRLEEAKAKVCLLVFRLQLKNFLPCRWELERPNGYAEKLGEVKRSTVDIFSLSLFSNDHPRLMN